MNELISVSLSYQRDKTGRVRRLISPEGQTDYLRNARGQVSRIEAPEGNYAFEYDAAGRIIQKNYPNGRKDLRIYDASGRVAAEFFMTTDASRTPFSASILNTHLNSSIPRYLNYRSEFQSELRKTGGLIQTALPRIRNAGNLDDLAIYLYDKNSNLRAKLNKVQTRFHGYDAKDRLTRTYGSGEFFASYGYDVRGNITRRQIRRHVSTYEYDAAGRRSKAREWSYGGNIPEGFDPSLVREHYRIRQAFGKHWAENYWILTEIDYRYDASGNLSREITTNDQAGFRTEKSYTHDALGRLREIQSEGGATRRFAYDGLDRKVYSGRRGGSLPAYDALSLFDGRRSVFEQDISGSARGGRTWSESGSSLFKGELLHRRIEKGLPEFISSEYSPAQLASLSIHTDRLGSAFFAAASSGKSLVRYDYSDFGEVYTWEKGVSGNFLPHTAKVPEELINREAVNRLYTGGTHDQLSGLIHLEARHYSPEKAKFIQPDPYNLAELSLPEAARNIMVQQAGLSLGSLLQDPAQQLSNSYVSGNPHKWVDPLGLTQLNDLLDKVEEVTGVDVVEEITGGDSDNDDYSGIAPVTTGEIDIEINGNGVGMSYESSDDETDQTKIEAVYDPTTGTLTVSGSCSL